MPLPAEDQDPRHQKPTSDMPLTFLIIIPIFGLLALCLCWLTNCILNERSSDTEMEMEEMEVQRTEEIRRAEVNNEVVKEVETTAL